MLQLTVTLQWPSARVLHAGLQCQPHCSAAAPLSRNYDREGDNDIRGRGHTLVQHVHKPDDKYFLLSSILFLDKIKYQNFWSLTSDPDCPKMAKLKA